MIHPKQHNNSPATYSDKKEIHEMPENDSK